MPICTWLPIPRVQEFHLIPLFSREQECVSEAFMRLRVAHLPQKPFCYSVYCKQKQTAFCGSPCISLISPYPGSVLLGAPQQILAALAKDSSLRLPLHRMFLPPQKLNHSSHNSSPVSSLKAHHGC